MPDLRHETGPDILEESDDLPDCQTQSPLPVCPGLLPHCVVIQRSAILFQIGCFAAFLS